MNHTLWQDIVQLHPRSFMCGYCGKTVAADKGYICRSGYDETVRICPNCNKPTYFRDRFQIPGEPHGEPVKNLPDTIESLYAEVRNCMQAGAFTACALLARKLLMNISVHQGAQPNQTFASYVKWLTENGYVPPKAKNWIDHLRVKGNEATHEVEAISQDDARDLVSFTSIILKMVYEFPAMVPQSKTS